MNPVGGFVFYDVAYIQWVSVSAPKGLQSCQPIQHGEAYANRDLRRNQRRSGNTLFARVNVLAVPA